MVPKNQGANFVCKNSEQERVRRSRRVGTAAQPRQRVAADAAQRVDAAPSNEDEVLIMRARIAKAKISYSFFHFHINQSSAQTANRVSIYNTSRNYRSFKIEDGYWSMVSQCC